MSELVSPNDMARLRRALPFWLSLGLIPLVLIGALKGGWWIALVPLATWQLFALVDVIAGNEESNADTETPLDNLYWYRLITLIWAPVQFVTLFGLIWYATRAPHLGAGELLALFFSMGILSGTVGIVYAHELMHQKPKSERWLGDLLMSMALYSHFRSEHLLVHHHYVGTPRDPITARYNEGFHRFFARIIWQCAASSFRAEKAMLARKKLHWSHRSNPFWRYLALQLLMLCLAALIGGWLGFGLFLFQAAFAIIQLELINYIEHYGLTRKHLGGGKYEHVMPHHSWNASHKASNWLLINLQRHSDHHYKPDRRFPLLQTYTDADAPQLPAGYPVMGIAALIPPVWRRVMNPKVRAWRRQFYPEIDDWSAYKTASNPMPR